MISGGDTASAQAHAKRKHLAPRQPDRRVLFLLAGTAVASVIALVLFIPRGNPDTTCCDHLFYRSMAYNFFTVTKPELNTPPPGNALFAVYNNPLYSPSIKPENHLNRQPPYVYRIATPLIARGLNATLFGGRVNSGFLALTLVCLALGGFTAGVLVWAASADALAAVIAVALFAVMSRNLVRDYISPDPLCLLLLAVGTLLVMRSRRLWLFGLCAAGAFDKEVVLLLLPCYLAWELLQHRARVSSYLLAAAAIIPYFAFRYYVRIPVNRYSLSLINPGRPHFGFLFEQTMLVFGVLALRAAVRLWRSPLLLSLLPLGLGCYVVGHFSRGDAYRAIIFAFPLVLVAVFLPARRGDPLSLRWPNLLPVVLYVGVEAVRSPLKLREPRLALVDIALFLAAEVAIWLWRRTADTHPARVAAVP